MSVIGFGLFGLATNTLKKQAHFTRKHKKKARKGACSGYFKNVKGFELNIATLLAQHVHHELEIVRIAYVPGHDGEVVAIEQELAEQLQRLSPRHVVVREQQLLVLTEELVVVLFEKRGAQRLVLRE
jgi:hypothetical protein